MSKAIEKGFAETPTRFEILQPCCGKETSKPSPSAYQRECQEATQDATVKLVSEARFPMWSLAHPQKMLGDPSIASGSGLIRPEHMDPSRLISYSGLLHGVTKSESKPQLRLWKLLQDGLFKERITHLQFCTLWCLQRAEVGRYHRTRILIWFSRWSFLYKAWKCEIVVLPLSPCRLIGW